MKKYKICPSCGAHNDPTAIECVECEEDLTTVKIVDEDVEKAAKNTKNESPESIIKKVKICYCGAKNPSNARKCIACGDDISTVIPVTDDISLKKKAVLSSLDGTYSYEIKEGSVVIGREKEMASFLADKKYVSRAHANIIMERDKIYIKSTGVNHSFINNVQIADNEIIEIKNGDMISFGGFEKNGEKQKDTAFLKLELK